MFLLKTESLGKAAAFLMLMLLAAVAASVPAAPAFPKATDKLNAGAPVKIVCFGDSVTGVYYHTGGRRAYTDMVEIGLQRAYPNAPITAINAGISGHTTVNALARINKDVLAHQPDIVTVMFGLNDMTRVPIETYRENLRAIVAKCRAIGAEVLLCTPNSIRDTESRPTVKLEQYVAVVREVALSEDTPLADCYALFKTIHNQNALNWAFLMSDTIHPNMDGHKRIAETIDSALIGKPVSLMDVPAPQPVIPRTADLIRAQKPLSILAMPPYDTLLTKLLGELAPASTLTMMPWKVVGQSMAQIETAAKGVRDKKCDLVFIAVPGTASADTTEAFIQSYSWVLNFSLSFGVQEWDVVAVHPSLATTLSGEDLERDAWAKHLIRGQDFQLIQGQGGSMEAAEAAVRMWLKEQLATGDAK